MTTTKAYDFLNRLQSIGSTPSADAAITFAYTYNNANQRTRRDQADTFWRYEYDPLGQVKSGKKYWSDGTPVAGQQFEYAFDIENRTATKAGGDQYGAGLRSADYGANLLNQYTNRTVPRGLDIIGVALATDSVAVNGQAAYRKGEYFWKEWTTNDNDPVYAQITVVSSSGSEQGHVLLPPATQDFTHDSDGNLAQDELWVYTWDSENRLLAMESLYGVPDTAKQRLDFAYDSQGRRIEKVVSSYDPNTYTYVPEHTNRFIYDGWNLVGVLDETNGLQQCFSWGTDLSGSLQGAGGVGGLLMMWDASALDSQPSQHFLAYDGNGNVTALVNADDSTVSGRYEYGPFGEVLRGTGPAALANPFRFSTKYQDEETGLSYYGNRYYCASAGRWLSRDPIEERGDRNIYAFVRNAPVAGYDALGKISVFPASGLTFQPCGGFNMDWAISLDSPAPAAGYVVQEVTINYSATTCDQRKITDSFTYWEAFPVEANQIQTTASGRGVDYWHYPASPNTKGSVMMSARAKFFVGDLGINAPPWQVGGSWGGGITGGVFGPPWSMSSGSFPSIGQEPGWWNNNPIEQGGDRFVSVTWSCCCPEFFTRGVAMYVGQ